MDADQIRQLRPQLSKYLRRFEDCFDRRDTRDYLPVYVEGQLCWWPFHAGAWNGALKTRSRKSGWTNGRAAAGWACSGT